jgi:hypothetical protein
LVDLCKDVPGDEEASKIYAIPLWKDKIKKSSIFWEKMCCNLQKTTNIFGEDVTSIFRMLNPLYHLHFQDLQPSSPHSGDMFLFYISCI